MQKEFFLSLLKNESIQEFLLTFKTSSERGYAYEMACNILIKFGFIDYFKPGKDTVHYEGNIDKGLSGLQKVVNLDYLVNGDTTYKKTKTGSSDITVKIGDKYYFCSVKYRNDIKLMLKDYEVDRIINKMISSNCEYEIVLIVKSKEIVYEKMRMTQSDKNVVEKIGNVIGLDEIEDSFQKFKKRILKSCCECYTMDFLLREKEFLELRFHQEMLINKTLSLIKEGHRDILWGCKPRSGKTYMAAGLIIMMDANVLITTNHPNEVRNEFIKLFCKYEDFNKFKIYNIKSKDELKIINSINEKDSIKNVVFVSKQLLQTMDIKNLKNKFSLTIYDENHDGGTTEISNEILKQIDSIVIYMTGTPLKSIMKWKIDEKARLMWTLEDEKMCKNIMENIFETQSIIDKFGKEANELIDVYIKHSILNERFKYYETMPSIYYITVLFNRERYIKLIKETVDSVYGFSFKTLFSLSENMKQFTYENEVKLFLRYISGSKKHIDFKNGDESIFRRISSLLQNKNSRNCNTQLWFLPPNNIDEVSECLKKLIEMDDILNKYTVLIINSKRNINDVKIEIEIAEEKGNVIILAGSMLQLGISIPKCDVVMLLHDSNNVDRLIQQSYRCMTESYKKEIGIVVDLNPGRVLDIMYSTSSNSDGIKNILKYNYTYNLINIDVDLFQNKNIDQEFIIDTLINEWLNLPVHSFTNILKRLDQEMNYIESDTQKLIYKCFNNIITTNNIKLKINIKENNTLKSGINRELIRFDEDSSSEDELDIIDETSDIKKIVILFKREILPYMIQLATVLTIDQNLNDFISMLKWIKNNNELISTFDEQTNTIWKQKNIIDFIILISNKLELSPINDICISIRLKIKGLIDHPEELLKLLNDCLKPKEIEKKENGEVFTPIPIVNEMLDKLPSDVWKNKNLKWFDPASGMGNFPIAVYLRLMDGLKDEIPNEKHRKKHIIENMIYMSEILKKNVIVCKQIFDINNEYKLNINTGDTLELDSIKAFNVKKFDIIIGNPPFNKGGIRSHTGKNLGEKNETIWPKFIEKSFNLLKVEGYLVFINPLSWLKKSHSLHDTILDKYIIWLKLCDNSQSKGMINADIPISFYVLQNKVNLDKKKTDIISILKRRNLNISTSEYLNKKYSIPLAYHNIFNKLINFIESKNLNLEYNTKTVKSSGEKKKLPSNYNSKDMLAIDTYTIKDGIMIKKATEKHPDADKRKLVIANKASFVGAFIDEGKLSLTGSDKTYILGHNLELILKILKFKISDIICHYTKYRQDFLEKEAYSYIPDIRKLEITDIEEEQFYNLIGFTTEEINLINLNNRS